MKTTYKTNYETAVNWRGNSYVRCNRIPMIDETFFDTIAWNILAEDVQFYQFFLTDAYIEDVTYLEEHFGLIFGYSSKLDLYVLCVDHYGTDWRYVTVDTDIERAECEPGEKALPF